MPFALSDDDCEIYYETVGSGAAIVFVPGFMGITDIWREQTQRFGAQFQCISFDTRGAGRSDKPVPQGSYGVDRHAADLASVLDAVKVGKVLLVGHSMGGNIACRFYRSNPKRVAGIIFVGSYVSGKQIDSVGNTLERIKAAVKMKLNRIDFYRQVGLPEEIAMEATKWPLHGINGNAESFMEFDASAELGVITVPCLVVHGSEDIVSPYDPCALGLIDALPDVESELLQGVNHCPMVEDAQATNNRIARFLEEKIIW